MAYKKTKKVIAEINRSRKASDRESMDGLHSLAISMDVEALHDSWLARLRWHQGTADSAKCKVDAFASSLLESVDPTYEMKWADEPMEAAATYSVFTQFVALLNAHGPDRAAQIARDEALRGAADSSQSTSASSNFMRRQMARQWARIATEYHVW